MLRGGLRFAFLCPKVETRRLVLCLPIDAESWGESRSGGTVEGLSWPRNPVRVALVRATVGRRRLPGESATLTLTETFDLVRKQLRRLGLGDEDWSIGELRDETPCLVFNEGLWEGGFCEHGTFNIHFSERDRDRAVAQFAEWVRVGINSTRESADATAKWLANRDEQRP